MSHPPPLGSGVFRPQQMLERKNLSPIPPKLLLLKIYLCRCVVQILFKFYELEVFDGLNKKQFSVNLVKITARFSSINSEPWMNILYLLKGQTGYVRYLN